MAQAPMPSAMPPPPGGAGPMMGADPMAGADPMMSDVGGDVIVTICSNGDGSYTVYAGMPPDQGVGDMSEEDAEAMGPAGAAPAPGGGASSTPGQPADSIGAALKIAMDILQADASSEGGPGSSEDQFAAGFSASQSPTPATGPAQKY